MDAFSCHFEHKCEHMRQTKCYNKFCGSIRSSVMDGHRRHVVTDCGSDYGQRRRVVIVWGSDYGHRRQVVTVWGSNYGQHRRVVTVWWSDYGLHRRSGDRPDVASNGTTCYIDHALVPAASPGTSCMTWHQLHVLAPAACPDISCMSWR